MSSVSCPRTGVTGEGDGGPGGTPTGYTGTYCAEDKDSLICVKKEEL